MTDYCDREIDRDTTDEGNPWMPYITSLFSEFGIAIDEPFQRLFDEYATNPAPASKGHHSNVIWGYWHHVYLVLREALELNRKLPVPYSEYQVAKLCICHDLSKVEHPPHPSYKVRGGLKEELWAYDPEPVYRTHETESIRIALRYFELDELEWNALELHHGPYGNVDIHLDWKRDTMSGLGMVLHLADMIASNLLEDVHFLGKSVEPEAPPPVAPKPEPVPGERETDSGPSSAFV